MKKIFGVGTLLLAACGSLPAPAPPATPDIDPKAVFRDLGKGASRPMVVDWSPEDRAALETRSSHGVVLVRIGEQGIEPLWDCALPDSGKYEFTGVSPKRDHVDARSDAELAANFPMSFAKLHAMVKSGQQITADIRLIGVAELNRASVRRADLPGACASATHFVKELTIGGFQFGATATRAGGGAAGVGHVGAEASYAGVSNRITEEGDFKVCEGADPDSHAAPGRCKGVLRVRLVPIGEDAKVAATTCASGTRWDGKACVEESAVHECRPDDAADCLAQCERGNGPSCRLAAPKATDNGTVKRLLARACEAKDWEGCTQLGFVHQSEHDEATAQKLYGLACINGNSSGCLGYGVSVYFGRGGTTQDRPLALKLWQRACRLGDFSACANAGAVLNLGEGGVAADPVTARKLFEVACKNDEPNGCANLAFMIENGIAGPKNVEEGVKLSAWACDHGNMAACVEAGLVIEEHANGDRARIKTALGLYEKACGAETVGDGCGSYEENKRNFSRYYGEEQLQRRSCDGGSQSELGCYNAAVLYSRAPLEDDAKMMQFARLACKSGHSKKDFCAKLR